MSSTIGSRRPAGNAAANGLVIASPMNPARAAIIG